MLCVPQLGIGMSHEEPRDCDRTYASKEGRDYVLKGNEIMSKTSEQGYLPPGTTGQAAKYLHVEDPDYVEPKTVLTTASTFPDPNRFDPYDALDSIQAAGLEFHDAVKLEKPFKLITVQVLALRAYITGMER